MTYLSYMDLYLSAQRSAVLCLRCHSAVAGSVWIHADSDFISSRTKHWSSGGVLTCTAALNLPNVTEKDTNWVWAKTFLAAWTPSKIQRWDVQLRQYQTEAGVLSHTREQPHWNTRLFPTALHISSGGYCCATVCYELMSSHILFPTSLCFIIT